MNTRCRTRITVYELVGYREWTESLGGDREHIIQDTQARIYSNLQRFLSSKQAFLLPLRYDYMIGITSSVREAVIKESLRVLEGYSPVPVRAVSVSDKSLQDAVKKATIMLSKISMNSLKYIGSCENECVAAIHFDVNDFTSYTSKGFSVYDTYVYVMDLFALLSKTILELDGILQYLGGDNIIAFINPAKVDLASNIIKDLKSIKAGIGLARTARKALELAAEGLDSIRKSGNAYKVISKILM